MRSLFLAATALLLVMALTDAGIASRSAPEVHPGVQYSFYSARPIWPKGRESEKNLFVGFRAIFAAPERSATRLRGTASSLYRAFINGEYVGYGPARGPHGYYRVDEWDISSRLKPGENVVAIEVAGYNVNSYYVLDQPSFLQAEVLSGERVLASTGGAGAQLEAAVLPYRIQKTQRYSFQRPFVEVYRLSSGYDRWRDDRAVAINATECALQPGKILLPRRVPYPKFALRSPVWDLASGWIERVGPPAKVWKDRSLTDIGPKLGGFSENELEATPSLELQQLKSTPPTTENRPLRQGEAIRLPAGSFRILDLGINLTGFLGARVSCKRPTRLFLTFDEILTGGDVDFKRLDCVNAITYELARGEYNLECFEPYTLRYLKLIALDGECELREIYLREYANPDVYQAEFVSSDRALNRIFEAARETLRQNALDIFMDCPSRERAGWLCDSFFTSRVAFDISGRTEIEKNFLENFLLPQKFAHLPDGMLPMCYPADHYNGVFIPNWALWFVIQLQEYLGRSGDRDLVDALKPKVLRLFDFFSKYRNSDGLLEKLPSWVFVEWSKANSFVQDVNYPSNMLYAGALDAAGRLYGLPAFVNQAEQVRATIRRQSFDGQFFVDNAVRRDGRLEVTRNRTEVCQYYAFYFGIASRESHGGLWRTLENDFGPKRKTSGKYPEVHPANAFIGDYLRLELLSRHGKADQILGESKDFFLKMADTTGTLWEHDDAVASCDHGFASHLAHVLLRDVLGLRAVDPVEKKVRLQFSKIPLAWCRGRLPAGNGFVEIEWWWEAGGRHYRARGPADYAISTEDIGDVTSIRHP